MPIKKSAVKRAKQNIVRRDHNKALKRTFRANVRNISKLLNEGKVKEAEKLVPETYKSLDKAAKRGTIHKNNANRRKSRLMSKIKNASETKKASPKKETPTPGTKKEATK